MRLQPTAPAFYLLLPDPLLANNERAIMSKTAIPTDFPRVSKPGAIGGFHPKALLRENNGTFTMGPTEDEIANRYEYCINLVDQLDAYCLRKLEQNPQWTVDAVVQRSGQGLRQKISSGEWPFLHDEEVRWIMTRVECQLEEHEGRRRTIQKVLQKLSWYTQDELSSLLGEHAGDGLTCLKTWEEQAKIFSVTNEGQLLYAKFQFDSRLQPIESIRQILSLLSTKGEWAIAAWFGFPNGWISELQDGEDVAVAPADVLMTRTEDVLNAALKERGTYVA